MPVRLALAALLALLVPAAAHARCAPSAKGGVSTNKKWKVEPTLEGRFTLSSWDEEKKAFVERRAGAYAVIGHHLTGHVADDGEHFAIHDVYDGFALFKADGTLVKKLGPTDLLTKEEAEKRPGGFACHKGGEWSDGSVRFASDSKQVTVGLHTGRRVALDVATGEAAWVLAGACATPDDPKAHGGADCIGKKWTCPRCRKAQEGLVWRICPACCGELGVCLVCNKKVEKPGAK